MDDAIIAVAVMSALTLSVKAIASAIVRHQENALRYRAQQPLAATDARLERIEQAVDAIAIEIERISEAQRFTTRLLSQKTQPDDLQHHQAAGRATPRGASSERVN